MECTAILVLLLPYCLSAQTTECYSNATILVRENNDSYVSQKNRTIHIKDDKIELIENQNGIGYVAQNSCVDLKDKIVIPGLIDLHIHLNLDATNCDKKSDKRCNSYQCRNINDNLQDYLLYGITTVLDLGAARYVIKCIDPQSVKPNFIYAGSILTDPSSPNNPSELEDCLMAYIECPLNEVHAKLLVREQKSLGASVIKIRDSDPNSKIRKAIIQEARKLDLIVVEHQIDMDKRLEMFRDSLILKPDLFAHAVLSEPISSTNKQYKINELTNAMKKNGVGIVTTLQVSSKYQPAIEEQGLTHLSRCKKRGVLFGLGSDSGFKARHGNGLYYEYDRITEHFNNWEVALKASTFDASKLLNLESQIGSFNSGAIADFLVLDTIPYNSDVIANYKMLIKSGKVVINNF